MDETLELIKLLGDAGSDEYNWNPRIDSLPEDVTWIDEIDLDQLRWQMLVCTIVEFKGQLYGIKWMRGLTEYQDSECILDTSTVYPVERVEKTVYTYKKI